MGPVRRRVTGTDPYCTGGCATATSMQQLINARCPTNTGTALIRCYSGSSLANVRAALPAFRARAHRNKRARTSKAVSANQTQMDFRGRKRPHRNTAATYAVADEQRSEAELVSSARIPAVESSAGNDERWSPREAHLSAMRVAAEREMECAVTNRANSIGRMHEHHARSVRSVHREIAARRAVGRIVEPADRDVREVVLHSHVLVRHDANAGTLERGDDQAVICAQIVIAENAEFAVTRRDVGDVRSEALNVCAAHRHIVSSEEEDVRFHRGECLTRFDQATLVGKSPGVKIRGERDAQRLTPRDACMDLCGGNSEPALKSERIGEVRSPIPGAEKHLEQVLDRPPIGRHSAVAYWAYWKGSVCHSCSSSVSTSSFSASAI